MVEKREISEGNLNIAAGDSYLVDKELLKGLIFQKGSLKELMIERNLSTMFNPDKSIKLTKKEFDKDTINGGNVGAFVYQAKDFLEKEKGLVIIEGIEYLIENNGFESVSKALNDIIDYVTPLSGALIVIYDSKVFTDIENAKLMRKFGYVSTERINDYAGTYVEGEGAKKVGKIKTQGKIILEPTE